MSHEGGPDSRACDGLVHCVECATAVVVLQSNGLSANTCDDLSADDPWPRACASPPLAVAVRTGGSAQTAALDATVFRLFAAKCALTFPGLSPLSLHSLRVPAGIGDLRTCHWSYSGQGAGFNITGPNFSKGH